MRPYVHDAELIKKTIQLRKEQLDELNYLADARGITINKLISEAIDIHIILVAENKKIYDKIERKITDKIGAENARRRMLSDNDIPHDVKQFLKKE